MTNSLIFHLLKMPPFSTFFCLFGEGLEGVGVFFVVLGFFLGGGTPAAYGSTQARGQTGAAATSLYHNHSNVESEPHLQPTPQLMATPEP